MGKNRRGTFRGEKKKFGKSVKKKLKKKKISLYLYLLDFDKS